MGRGRFEREKSRGDTREDAVEHEGNRGKRGIRERNRGRARNRKEKEARKEEPKGAGKKVRKKRRRRRDVGRRKRRHKCARTRRRESKSPGRALWGWINTTPPRNRDGAAGIHRTPAPGVVCLSASCTLTTTSTLTNPFFFASLPSLEALRASVTTVPHISPVHTLVAVTWSTPRIKLHAIRTRSLCHYGHVRLGYLPDVRSYDLQSRLYEAKTPPARSPGSSTLVRPEFWLRDKQPVRHDCCENDSRFSPFHVFVFRFPSHRSTWVLALFSNCFRWLERPRKIERRTKMLLASVVIDV